MFVSFWYFAFNILGPKFTKYLLNIYVIFLGSDMFLSFSNLISFLDVFCMFTTDLIPFQSTQSTKVLKLITYSPWVKYMV